jgi:hypothetical protein
MGILVHKVLVFSHDTLGHLTRSKRPAPEKYVQNKSQRDSEIASTLESNVDGDRAVTLANKRA